MSCTKYDDFYLGLIEAGEMKKHLETCPECRRQAALDERLTIETASLREPVDDAGLWSRIEAGLLEKGVVAADAVAAKRVAGDEKEVIERLDFEPKTASPAAPSVSPSDELTLGVQGGRKRVPGSTKDKKASDSAARPSALARLFSQLTFTSGPPTFARTAGVAVAALAVFGLAAWFLFIRPSPGSDSGLMADAALARVENEEREYAAAIEELEAKAGSKLAEMDFSLMALYRDRLETIDSQIERCREAIAQNPWNAHIRRYMLAALRDKKDTLGQILSQQ